MSRRRFSKPLPGVVCLDGGRVRVAATAMDGHSLEAVTGREFAEGCARCLFKLGEDVVEVQADVRRGERSGRVTLQLLSVTSDTGRGPIERFVSAITGRSRWPGAVWERNGAGRTMILPAEDAVFERRERSRALSRREVQIGTGGDPITAVVTEVSEEGLRLETLFELPVRRQPVWIAMKIKVGRLEMAVRAHGKVTWTRSPAGGTPDFGVQIDRVDDGAAGRHWRRFVEGEAEENGAVKAFRHGQALPEGYAPSADDERPARAMS